MGSVSSTVYNYCRRKILRYNVQERALKFVDKGRLPSAPRHPIPSTYKPKENIDEPLLKDIHTKSEELNEYLKKVYLTSTSENPGIPSKKPLPKKENEQFKTFLYYEPETPRPGQITLTQVIELLFKTQSETDFSTAAAIAKEYNLDKKDASNLIAYYSLFRLEKFDFMNAEAKKDSADENKSITSSEFEQESKRIAAK